MTNSSKTKVYFAKWILDSDFNIIENGIIVVSGDTISWVGERRSVNIPAGAIRVDLGETLLMPGLINIHTHLEQGACRYIKKEHTESFSAWEDKRRDKISGMSSEDLDSSRLLALREAISSGCTTIADFSSRPLGKTEDDPVRMLRIKEFSSEDLREERLPEEEISMCTGVSPYSLYSMPTKDQNRIKKAAEENNLLWAAHAAESSEEFQAFTEKTGNLYLRATRKDPWPYKEKKGTIIEQAISERVIPDNGILIHCNYISSMDMLLLKPKNISLVVCPVYSSYAEHKQFPYEVASRSGLNICIGTEAPIPENKFDIINEFFEIKKNHPYIPVKRMLKWVTVNPAAALGISSITGRLKTGMKADITGVTFTYPGISDPAEQLVEESPEVICVISNGEEIIMP